jgi:hypothetical protein
MPAAGAGKSSKLLFEVIMFYADCLGCNKRFPFEPGKKFHSNLCRSNFYEAQRVKKFHELWEQTSEFDYPESMRSLSPEDKFRIVIEGLAKTEIHYYRLGIPRNAVGTTLEVRWFPMGGGGRRFLLVNPFEAPMDLPVPGLYLVALFDRERKAVGKPGWKLPVVTFNVACRWSSGTRVP